MSYQWRDFPVNFNASNRGTSGLLIPSRSALTQCKDELTNGWQQENRILLYAGQTSLASPVLSRQLHTLITIVCDLPSLSHAARSQGTSFADSSSPLVRRSYCPSRSDRKTRHRCTKRAKPKCPRHLYFTCDDCL